MRSQAMFFQEQAAQKACDPQMQKTLAYVRPLFVGKRKKGLEGLAGDGLGFEEVRAVCQDIRDRVVGNLDVWLELFEERAQATGAEVLWARDGDEVARLLVDLARQHGVRKVVKSKSMLSEEADLNAAFAAAGIESIETDLGEYIIQLAGETPSHIIAPAVHKTKEEVADLFVKHHGLPRQSDITALAREARAVLRQHFLSADMGVSGANFLLAETGSAVLVTNEGNGRMVTTLPRLHVVIAGIEKIIPNLQDLATLLRLLPRSATGQSISNYVSVLTPRGGTTTTDASVEGPEKIVFVLVDNGRSSLLGGEFASMLRCIRCGACMNHCPVYTAIGGHAYGWVYPGPMGSVLTPLYTSLKTSQDLPQATTGCNQCGAVCPVGIPLPELMRALRRRSFEQGLRPWLERLGYKVWAWAACHPRFYHWGVRRAVRYLKWLAGGEEYIRVLGMAPGWTGGRDLKAPPGRSFQELYMAQKRNRSAE